jgi:Protein of unknown function (DUF433)
MARRFGLGDRRRGLRRAPDGDRCAAMLQPVLAPSRDAMEGTAVFRGTRMPVQALLDYPEAGGTIDDLLTMAKRSNVLRARRSILVAITTSSTVRAGWPARPLPFLAVHLRAPCLATLLKLRGERLPIGADAGIADRAALRFLFGHIL